MKRNWIPLTALLLGGMAVGAWGAEDAAADDATPSDAVVLGEEDLADRAEILRNMYRRITPPAIPLVQDVGTWPTAWEEFGAEWNSAALDREYGAWVVPVEVSQEAGETVVRDGNGTVQWRGRTDFARPESADVVLTGGLVAEEEWAVYEGIREVVTAMAAESSRVEFPGRTQTNEPSGLRFTGHEWTSNGTFRLELAYETDTNVDIFAYAVACTSSLVVATWTNDENQVVTDTNTVWQPVGAPFNGIESDWIFRGTVAISNGVAVFEDGGFPDTLSRQRFYAAVVAQDTDGDGLNDGWESFVYHTDSTVADSDGDGWGDGMEVAVGFNPADAGAVPKLTIRGVMYDPAGTDGGKEWVELYSASPTALPLEGFRLEVGRGGVWSNVLEFASGASIAPWRCLLVGESGVTNADVHTTLQIPNAMSNAPTTGVRLRWSGATNGAVADAVFIGRNPSFNTNHLDATGWLSTSSVWSYAGKVVERRFPGLDTDQTADWRWENARAGQDSSVAIDSDGDGLSDADECTGSCNPFGEPTNQWSADSDGDGLSDYAECVTHGTNPNTWATDGDIWPWMAAGTPATNWPGSDSWELATTNNPLAADANGNAIPDTWEWMVGLDALTGDADTDGDGITDLDELRQNSNPFDASDSAAKPYVVAWTASREDWVNGTTGVTDNDIGLGGHVQMHFLGAGNAAVVAWVSEGNVAEPFSMTWSGLATGDCEYSSTGDYGITHALLSGNAVLTIRDAAEHPEFINTLGGEYSIGYAMVDVAFADPDDSGWGNLPEERVVLCDEDLRVRIRVVPEQDSLQAVFGLFGSELELKTSGTAPAGQALALSSANTVFVQNNGFSELRIALTRQQLAGLGLLPSNGEDGVDEKAWMDFGSLNPADDSNLSDSHAFDSGIPHESRGQSTRYGGLDETPPNSPLDKTFFQAAGRELVTASYARCESEPRQIMNQADVFYYSGHGNHRTGVLQGDLSGNDVATYWNRDLEWVIFAGCSVLDIKGYRAQSFPIKTKTRWLLRGGGASPGTGWESCGPKYFLGYNWRAPLDIHGATTTVDVFLAQLRSGHDIPESWANANDNDMGRNACVLDCSSSTHRYWYWDERGTTPIWTNRVKNGGNW